MVDEERKRAWVPKYILEPLSQPTLELPYQPTPSLLKPVRAEFSVTWSQNILSDTLSELKTTLASWSSQDPPGHPVSNPFQTCFWSFLSRKFFLFLWSALRPSNKFLFCSCPPEPISWFVVGEFYYLCWLISAKTPHIPSHQITPMELLLDVFAEYDWLTW